MVICSLTFVAEGYPDRVMPREDVQNTKLVTWQAPEGLCSAGRAGDSQ